MKVLVVYASRHGGTRGIAERIGAILAGEGLETRIVDVEEARDVDGVDAFVIGSAVYIGGWLKDAEGFVRKHRGTLASHPVWLFSSGPLGTSLVDAEGKDVLEDPKVVTELRALVGARGHRVFFGAYDPNQRPAAMSERLVRIMPASKELLPPGDFRDWPAIESFAREIAAELRGAPVGA